MGRVPSRNTRKVTADELSVRLGVLEDRIAGLLLALEVKVDKDIQSLKDDVKRLKVIWGSVNMLERFFFLTFP